MGREARTEWTMTKNSITGNYSHEQAQLAVLMDLRDLLDRLVAVLECRNFTNIPRTLRAIARNTARYRCRACPRTFESSRGVDQHVRRAHA